MNLRPLNRFLLGALCAAGLTAGAQNFESVSAAAKTDLDRALAELAEVQNRIAAEKIPLAQRVNQAEEQVLAKRRDHDRLQRARDNQLVELNALKTEVKRRQDEHNYLAGLLNEYAQLFETRIHISEAARFDSVVKDAKTATTIADLPLDDKFAAQLALVDTSLKRLEGLLGGETFAARALSPQGRLEQGKVALAGPVALFAADSGVAGLVELQLGSPEPAVIALEPAHVEGLKSVVIAGDGQLPLDATLGNALKIAATADGFVEHIRKGGPVMWPIVSLAIAGILIALFKWVQIARIRIATPMDLQAILRHLEKGERAAAMNHAQAVGGPTGQLLVAAVEHAEEKKEYIEEVLYEVMLNVKPRLEKLLPLLALIAAAAPLLGLLGTVTGMINTFNMISVFGTGDPKTLSSGISEALITTEWGLYVAIPALLSQALLSRKVKGVLGSMEQLTVGYINGLPEKEETPFK